MSKYYVYLAGPLETALLKETEGGGGVSTTIRTALQQYLMADQPEAGQRPAPSRMLVFPSDEAMKNIKKEAGEKGVHPMYVVRQLLDEVFGS